MVVGVGFGVDSGSTFLYMTDSFGEDLEKRPMVTRRMLSNSLYFLLNHNSYESTGETTCRSRDPPAGGCVTVRVATGWRRRVG